jgi:His/Glu/Gln/Arg/opine family amino acid ABC transporter permease subunit
MYEFDWSVVVRHSWFLLQGIPLTLYLAAASIAFGLVVGLFVGLGRLSRFLPLRVLLAAYVEICRNTPVLVFIVWVYYALPLIAGVNLSPLVAGILALGLNASGYLAEVFRAGIQGVSVGQTEAARSLGMSHAQALRKIILPQAVRRMIPPFVNTFVVLIKETPLVAFIGVLEVVKRADVVTVTTFRPLEVYTVIALIYLVLIVAVSQVLGVFERRVAIVE